MARKRGKTSQKSSINSAKPVKHPSTAQPVPPQPVPPQPSDDTSGFIARKMNKPAISTTSLFSKVDLMEGITIRYSKNEDIPALIHEANPAIRLNCIKRLWRSIEFPLSPTEANKVIKIDQKSTCQLAVGALCMFYEEQMISAIRINTPTLKTPDNWIMFVADDIMSGHVVTFSDYNSSKHFLHFENGILRWNESSGNLDVIRAHIDDTETTSYALDKLTDLKERLVLLCAGSGSGKTTLLSHLANQAKEEQPDSMVLSISLSDHVQLLESEMAVQPLDFLRSAAGIVSPGELSSFESALDEERLFVLFDCLDELSPSQLEKCCDLFQGLYKTFIKTVLVIVGKEQKKYLEDQLSTLAADLCEFSNEDQKRILKICWKKLGSKKLDEDQLDAAANKLIQATSQSISDLEREFVGTALQMQILADYFENDSVNDIPENLTFMKLFQYNFERYSTKILKNHEYAALYLILGKEKQAKLLKNDDEENFQEFLQEIKNGQEHSGIIDGLCNGKPHFINSVFLHYFAANWFARCEPKDKHISHLLFTPEFKKSRFFFNREFASYCPLHTSVLNDNLEQVKVLLDSGVDVNARDQGGRTALHLAASLGVATDEKVTAVRNEILDLLINSTTNFKQEDDILGATCLQYANVTQSWSAIDKLLPHFPELDPKEMSHVSIRDQEMFEYIVDNDLGSLMTLCFQRGFVLENTKDVSKQLLPKSCKLGSVRVAAVLISNGANIWITYGEIISPLHTAAQYGHLQIVRLLINASKSTWESLRCLMSKLPQGRRLPPFSVYVNLETRHNETVIDLAICFAQLDVVKYLLREKAVIGGTIRQMQRSVGNAKCDPEIVKTVLSAIREDEIKMSINSIMPSTENNTVHSAVITGNKDMVRYLLNAGGSATKARWNGRTPLMIAAWWGHLDVVKLLVNRVPYERRMNYINAIAEDEMTALQCAAIYGYPDVIEYLMEQNAKKGRVWELIIYAAGNIRADPKVVELVLSAIPAYERARYINKPADNGCTAVQLATREGNLEGLKMLIQAGGKVLNRCFELNTPLIEAATNGSLEIVQLLVESAVRQGISKRSYINIRGACELTALHFAIARGHVDIVNYLLREKADMASHVVALSSAVLNPKGDVKVVDAVLGFIPAAKRLTCVTQCRHKGNTVMHLASRSGNLEMIARFVEIGAKMSVENALKETPLMIVASKGYIRAVKYLLDKFDEEKEGMKKLKYINMRNQDGQCAVSLANKFGHKAVTVFISQALLKLLQIVLE